MNNNKIIYQYIKMKFLFQTKNKRKWNDKDNQLKGKIFFKGSNSNPKFYIRKITIIKLPQKNNPIPTSKT